MTKSGLGLVPCQLSPCSQGLLHHAIWFVKKVAVRKEFFYVGFCDINPKYYPYDSHNCLIQGISYQPLNINLTYSNIIHSKMINNYHTKWLIGETKLTKVRFNSVHWCQWRWCPLLSTENVGDNFWMLVTIL